MAKQVAVITGASAGLGEQFAFRFARDGHDVVLAARNTARLEAIAERLRVHKISPYVIGADLSHPDGAQKLFDEVARRGLDIEYLVNNAGAGSSGAFLDQPLEGEGNLVELNCNSLLKLTHLFATKMKARGHGRILNIASTAGFQPGPYMATYFATKAFVVSFSEALAFELQKTGVSVTCYCPGPIATEFPDRSGNGKTRLFKRGDISKPEDVAHEAFEAMMRGDVLAVHGFVNWVTMQSVRFSPRAVVRTIAAALNQPPEA
jgi:short-subunit dehydrogenase